ncbi:MAG: hypothetical protein CSA96_01980 [Bacteroidetes bacterium]|nr:MAG: hypothetical protein CSA96_01980 [Bacteroidota bacterium]
MDELFTYRRKGFRGFLKENRLAILYTLIIHMVIAIVMVFTKVEGLKEGHELGVLLEFEEKTIEEILEEEEADVPAEWLEQVIAEREISSNRAVNVNAENAFSSDISTDAYVDDLLKQIEEARNEADREKIEELQAILALADYVPEERAEKEEQSEFSGPTTITYEFLEMPKQRGRKQLSIPVYRCQGSGRVQVEVRVRQDGTVSDARVREPIEGMDRVCFAKAALEAARSSRFRIDMQAPSQHRALLTYTFVAQ